MKFPSIKLEAEAKKNKGYFRADSSREVMSAYATIDVPLYQSGNSSSKIRETKRQLFSMQEKKKMKVNSSVWPDHLIVDDNDPFVDIIEKKKERGVLKTF